ncbi:MAG TPA: hypothetical protein VFE53_20055 [Mucilaginibacter sp.]|jgi:hypothetical protein|nr:hypothetical protein [Mucilaginibacter sp.]
MKRATAGTAVILVTLYVMAFVVVLNVGALFFLAPWLFTAFPFLLLWMVWTVLTDDRQKYPTLGKNEWGYRDKNRDDLGFF